MQWFLSFYLIFLMESKNENRNAILLLDEAGLTLHPLAQRDLVTFFENLAMENQIIQEGLTSLKNFKLYYKDSVIMSFFKVICWGRDHLLSTHYPFPLPQ